jgi:hypothetical protein
MEKVVRIVAIFLVGVVAIMFSTSVEARRGKVRFHLTKEQKEEKERKRAEAEKLENEKRALKKFEEKAREHALYQECAIRTEAIEHKYLGSPEAKASDVSSTDEYLFRVYLRTVKWDGDCFEWKDPAAAERSHRTLKAYVIGGVHPALKEQLKKLFEALENEECMPGVKCKPGITSAFRDDFRQEIATGFKARTGRSMHGGSQVTKGWGDGRAVDVVNVSEPDFFNEPKVTASEIMWHHIDRLGPKVGIYRPMPDADPMHLQSMGLLRSLMESGKRKMDSVIEKTKEVTPENVKKNTEKVIKKFKKKKCRFRSCKK